MIGLALRARSDNIDQRSSDMQKMITERAAAQIEQMTTMVNARRDAEIARLPQQEQAMKHRIEHDIVRNTQDLRDLSYRGPA